MSSGSPPRTVGPARGAAPSPPAEEHPLSVVRFESAAQARAWIESSDYRPLRDIRHKSARSKILIVAGVR